MGFVVMKTTRLRIVFVLFMFWGFIAALPLDEDGEDLSVIGLPPKDKSPIQTTTSKSTEPNLTPEERHGQIDEYLLAHRAELGDVVDQWFNSRWSGSRWD